MSYNDDWWYDNDDWYVIFFDNNDNQVKGLVSRLDELETELEGERNNRGKAEKSRCHLVSIFRTPFLRIVNLFSLLSRPAVEERKSDTC